MNKVKEYMESFNKQYLNLTQSAEVVKMSKQSFLYYVNKDKDGEIDRIIISGKRYFNIDSLNKWKDIKYAKKI